MKGNIKRLALLIIVAVTAPVILAATVTADPNFPPSIRGQYAATGGGTCLIAVCGFDPTFVPLHASSGTGVVQSNSFVAVYTFEPDGTGSASGTIIAISSYALGSVPIGAPSLSYTLPSAGIQTFSFTFKYTLRQDDNLITIHADTDSYVGDWVSGPTAGSSYTLNPVTIGGYVSYDGMTITLNSITLSGGIPEVITLSPPMNPSTTCGGTKMICNNSFVLIYMLDVNFVGISEHWKREKVYITN